VEAISTGSNISCGTAWSALSPDMTWIRTVVDNPNYFNEPEILLVKELHDHKIDLLQQGLWVTTVMILRPSNWMMLGTYSGSEIAIPL